MSRVVAWCLDHRRAVIVLWVVALVAAAAAAAALGSRYSSNFSLGSTDSQRAADLLHRTFPAQSGDHDQIVVHASGRPVTDPAVRARIETMLARVRRAPHVVSVSDPFAPRAPAVAPDRRTAFAAVLFDRRSHHLPREAVRRVIALARAARGPGLEVELGGPAIEQFQRAPAGLTEAVGLAAAVVVLLVSFGSLMAMGLPIVTALFGLGTGMAVVTLLTRVLDTPSFATQLAAMIGFGVGVDYALFILTRYREAYADNGGDVRAAIVLAMETAGRAVLFAGATVVIALMGMLVLGIGFLHGLAIAASIAVLLVLAASLTLLPALLSLAGARVGATRRRGRAGRPRRQRFWPRWVGMIQRRPWTAALVSGIAMLVLCLPATALRLGQSDAGNDRAATTTRRAYDLLARGFGPGFNGPLLVAARLPRRGGGAAAARIAARLRGVPDVAAVAPPRMSPSGAAAVVLAYPRTAPQSARTAGLVHALRADVVPGLERSTGTDLHVGGATATQIDFAVVLAGKLWVFIAVIVGLSALLLLVVFRSLVIPLQAAAMNLLSIGAALGVVVAVFQWGWLRGPLGIEAGPVEAFLPVMMFAIVFGLSMDYEVFLVSRVHEEWELRGDASAAVREGLIGTGRVITAAAAVMVTVFASFLLGGERVIELFGLGLAGAVLLDAVVIRCALLPAVLELLGRRTWSLPPGLERRLPRVSIEHGHRQSPRDAAFEQV